MSWWTGLVRWERRGGDLGNRSYVDGGGEGSGLGGGETLEGVFVGHYIREGILLLDLFIQCLSLYYSIQHKRNVLIVAPLYAPLIVEVQ